LTAPCGIRSPPVSAWSSACFLENHDGARTLRRGKNRPSGPSGAERRRDSADHLHPQQHPRPDRRHAGGRHHRHRTAGPPAGSHPAPACRPGHRREPARRLPGHRPGRGKRPVPRAESHRIKGKGFPMHQLTLAEIARGLKDKTFSSAELTGALLARIQQLDPQLNSFITVTEELARAQAQAADARRAAGEEGALLGAPIGHKDLFCTQGVLTSCASKILTGFKAPYDATVVAKLAAAGTVTLGKLNMDEFAMGSANESSHYGAVKNPWDLTRVPGGSSGGS